MYRRQWKEQQIKKENQQDQLANNIQMKSDGLDLQQKNTEEKRLNIEKKQKMQENAASKDNNEVLYLNSIKRFQTFIEQQNFENYTSGDQNEKNLSCRVDALENMIGQILITVQDINKNIMKLNETRNGN
ncbi:UNKNOWN [Stylonychia lemnae]|uniref:Uncharacterized protein n=1 Tax=Stylonychia lemnae TaxID=5949 RepID=A0A078B2K4_STYLE|nr:UNKNOWN [Stylonychia lemnae]|eukprot:CDW87713.1 UNKNOWN [Stylonychia lemnae]